VYNDSGSIVATGGADALVKIWAAETLELSQTFSDVGQGVSSLDISPFTCYVGVGLANETI
jgi:WD40 repeat protein